MESYLITYSASFSLYTTTSLKGGRSQSILTNREVVHVSIVWAILISLSSLPAILTLVQNKTFKLKMTLSNLLTRYYFTLTGFLNW